MRLMKLPPQLFRLVLLTIGIVVVYLTARYFLTPPSFGAYGWYRANALEERASQTPVYAGKQACDECHSEVLATLAAHKHKTLSCETCHGVGKAHAENPDVEFSKLSLTPCMRCHEANPTRPKWYPQITIKDHYTGERCTECHSPHEPNEVPDSEEDAKKKEVP